MLADERAKEKQETKNKQKDKRSIIRCFRRIRMNLRPWCQQMRTDRGSGDRLTLACDLVQHPIEGDAIEQPPAQNHAVDAANVRDIRQRIG
jgi:hypothetical protein